MQLAMNTDSTASHITLGQDKYLNIHQKQYTSDVKHIFNDRNGTKPKESGFLYCHRSLLRLNYGQFD